MEQNAVVKRTITCTAAVKVLNPIQVTQMDNDAVISSGEVELVPLGICFSEVKG